MSGDTEHEIEQDEGPDRGFLVRTFAAELTAGEGRTVDVRIVPYGERATVADGFGGVPKGVPYVEEWMPGVFDGQVKAANRVLANFEHQTGLAGVVGHGLQLREARDGFHGSFKLHDTPDGEKALMLVREGVLGGVSLEAVPKKSVRTAAGVVQRVKAHLKAVALCREPAYTGAVVLAVREQQILLDEALLPVEFDEGLAERCRRLGISIPQRTVAHPDEAGTPDMPGTPADGTRQTMTDLTMEAHR